MPNSNSNKNTLFLKQIGRSGFSPAQVTKKSCKRQKRQKLKRQKSQKRQKRQKRQQKPRSFPKTTRIRRSDADALETDAISKRIQ